MGRFTAITRLAISPSPNVFLKVAPGVVESASFPHLFAFDLHDNTRPSIGKQILTLHMSRLVSLHITQDTEIPRSSFSELFSGLLFPRLESFTLRSRNEIAFSDLLSTLAVATPALTSLCLIDLALAPSAVPAGVHNINGLMPTLRDLSIRNVTGGGLHTLPLGSALVSMRLPYLTQLEYGLYPRLTSLSVIDVFPVAIVQSTVAVLSRLRRLAVEDLHTETVQYLSSATGLVALSVSYFPDAMLSLTSAFMHEWRLPVLEKLALTQHETSNSRCNTVALVLRLLASDSHWPFKRLRHLKLCVGETNTRAERRDVISDLLKCIDKLERFGVERVTVKGLERRTETDFREQLSVKRRELRWLELLF